MKTKKENIAKIPRKTRVQEEQKVRIYFCPYCKMLYSDPVLKQQFKFNPHTNKFKCLFCNSPYFNNSTYDKLAKSKDPIRLKSRKYHLGKSVEASNVRTQEKVNNLISKDILDLKDKGFSNREIHQITHYSRHKVNAVIESSMTQENDEMSIETFFKERLRLSPEPSTTNEKKKDIVKRALLYGCTYAVIRHLVPMRKIEITNISVRLRFEETSRKEMAINRAKRKIKILDDGVEKRVSITTREEK